MATPKKSSTKKSSGAKRVGQNNWAGITFPVAKTGRFIRQGKYVGRLSAGAAVFVAATLEYLVREVSSAAAKLTKAKQRISPRAITLAVRDDAELSALLANVTIARGGVAVTGTGKKEKKEKKAKKGKKAAAKGEAKKASKKSGGKKKGGKKSSQKATQKA